MIIVYGIIESTSDDIASIRDAVVTMETATRKEAGCIDYTFSVAMSDPNCIRISEKWESAEALKAHMQTPHMAEFQQAIAAHPPKSAEIKFFEAEEVSLA